MEVNDMITLNFLPLEKQEFEFKVWRRKYVNNEKGWDEEIRKYKLPDEQGNYKDYWVSFKEFDSSKEFTVNSYHNIELTKFYLFKLLKEELKNRNIEFHSGLKKYAPYRIYIIVEKTNYGERAIFFEPYYLRIDTQFGFLVDYKFLKITNQKFNREIQKLSFSLDENYKSNKNYHIDKYRYIEKFFKDKFSGISLLDGDIKISKEFKKIRCEQLETKIYIFNGSKEDNSQFNGIMNYGPYKKIVNTNSINYLYIFQENHKDYVNDLIKALNGISFQTFKGFDKFKIPNQTRENTKGISLKSFDNIEEVLIQNNITENTIVIAVFPQQEEKFYYSLKSYYLKNNIPLQGVHLETIRNENSLKWSISSIALQMFAKLGGTPWIVKTNNNDCLIVGIGQAIDRDQQKKPIRFYAYSVLLNSSGEFLSIEPLAEGINSKDQYLKSISERVSKILDKYKNYKKVVFHIPEKIKIDVAQTIEKTIKERNDRIEVYIIRINDDSKFFGYNLNSNSLIPYESSCVRLSNKEFLVWTEGLNYHNPIAWKRYGNPIYVDFYYSSLNESDIDFKMLLQDILNLSGANYRGFNAKSLPVSMFYPKLIADFYKHFSELNLEKTIKETDKPWFL